MTGWEVKDLLAMLKKAQEGDIGELNQMTASYTSGCTVDKEYSTMVIRRQFDVDNKDGERYILYSEPTEGDNTSADKQWGLTIIQLTQKGDSVSSFCIPNSLKNPKIRLLEDNILEILSNEKTITTNISEIKRKLKPIFGTATEKEIEEAFNTLSSQQYIIQSLIEVVHQSLESKTLGTLEFEDEEYVSLVTINNNPVRIIISLAEAEDLLKIVDHADKLMSDLFYERALKGMYSPMLERKNDFWLEEEEEDSDAEPSILTLDEFKDRITITEITFNQDHTVNITCDADGMFEDHDIVITTDTKGNYKDAALAD